MDRWTRDETGAFAAEVAFDEWRGMQHDDGYRDDDGPYEWGLCEDCDNDPECPACLGHGEVPV